MKKLQDIVHTIATLRMHDSKFLDELTLLLSTELAPLCMLGPCVSRVITKPLGYAGDYITIDMIYNYPEADKDLHPVGAAIDKAFFELPAAKAVQNRRGLLTKEIREVASSSRSGEKHITTLACGPAREVQDYFMDQADNGEDCDSSPSKVNFHLLDLDKNALDLVNEWRQSTIHPSQASRISLYEKNLIYLCVGKEKIDLPPQDLVYSMGLIDYFSDEVVVRLLNYIHDVLKPGGKVILGNFHKRNPTRVLMDTLLDWKLIHRDEEDMNRLFRRSKFGRGCTEIISDETGVQLLACCEK